MNFGVLTSGGDSPGMNAAIRAVVRQGFAAGVQVFGFTEGYRGLADNEFVRLTGKSVSETIDRGGTILRTARFEAFKEREVQLKCLANLRNEKIDTLIVVGGEGSMRGADCLVELGAGVIGVPASIDNDIYGTDYSIGFDTALNTVIEVLGKLRDTASAHERIFVVEVMGRRSGAIALNAGLAGGADYVCLPDKPATDPGQLKKIVELTEKRFSQGKNHTLIVVAEGAGSAGSVSEAVQAATGREVRISILGHIQRGGSPSALDRVLASRLGAGAVDLAVTGGSGLMIGLVGNALQTTSLKDTFTKSVETDKELLKLAKTLA